MNFFNIGPMELILILALALIIFGPSRLPEIAKGLGKAINDFRQASEGLTDGLNRELSASATPTAEKKPAEAATERPGVPPAEEGGAVQVQEPAPAPAQEFSEPSVAEIPPVVNAVESEETKSAPQSDAHNG